MSVADEIQTLTSNLHNAYVSVANKGGTVPQNKNTEMLPIAIESIPTGGLPLPKVKYYDMQTNINFQASQLPSGINSITVSDKQTFINFVCGLPTNYMSIMFDVRVSGSIYSLAITDGGGMGGSNPPLLYADTLQNLGSLVGLTIDGVIQSNSSNTFVINGSVLSTPEGDVIERGYTSIQGGGIVLETNVVIPGALVKEIELKGNFLYGSAIINPLNGTASNYPIYPARNLKKIKFLENTLINNTYSLSSMPNLEEIDVGNNYVFNNVLNNKDMGWDTISQQEKLVDRDQQPFSSNLTSPAFTNGVVITGNNASDFMTRFPNYTGTYQGRNFRLAS